MVATAPIDLMLTPVNAFQDGMDTFVKSVSIGLDRYAVADLGRAIID